MRRYKFFIFVPLVITLIVAGCQTFELGRDGDQDEVGYLTINSEPEGAIIKVDGEEKGETPLRLGGVLTGLEPGEYKVEAEHDDFQPMEEKVVIETGEEYTLDFDFEGEQPLIAEISSDITQTREGREIVFFGGNSVGEIETFHWDFDDGTTETGETVGHVFEDEGEYDVKLKVISPEGNEDSTERKITISEDTPTIREETIEVTIPETYEVEAEDLNILTVADDGSEVDEQSRSEVEIGDAPTQVIMGVENEYERSVLLGYVFSGESGARAQSVDSLKAFSTETPEPIELSNRSSALALAMLDPALAGSSGAVRTTIAEKVLEHEKFSELEEKLEKENIALF